MPEPTLDQLARHAAASAARRPEYLASVLAAYQRQERLDDAALAHRLGLPEADLAWLRLCLRPRPAQFAADIDAIARRFKLNPAALTQAIRQVDSVQRFLQAPAVRQPGLLAAAREQGETYQGAPEDADETETDNESAADQPPPDAGEP